MSRVTRCKFTCNEITQTMGGRYRDVQGEKTWTPEPVYTIKMAPVYHNGDPEHENSKFWEASPAGSFEIQCVNKEAVEHLEVGGEYYLDITPAPKPEAGAEAA